MNLDRSNRHVRLRLAEDHNIRYGLEFGTDASTDGRVTTAVRNRWRDGGRPWTEQHAQAIADALRSLPGAEVRLYAVRDMVVVTWDGVPS